MKSSRVTANAATASATFPHRLPEKPLPDQRLRQVLRCDSSSVRHRPLVHDAREPFRQAFGEPFRDGPLIVTPFPNSFSCSSSTKPERADSAVMNFGWF